MSIIAAVTKRKRTVLAADTLYLTGGQKDYADDLIGRAKVRAVGDSLVGMTGWSVYQNVFEHYLSKRRPPRLTTERAVFDFFLKFWKALHEQYTFVKDQRDSADGPFSDLDSSFIIANRKGIFDVHGNMTVWQHRDYCAIGSGAQYAYGALHVLYQQSNSARDIAVAAVETAIRFDDGCGGEVETFAVT